MRLDNGPNIGHFGPAELAKEARWATEIKAAWADFQRTAGWFCSPGRAPEECAQALRLYQSKHGEDAARTLMSYVEWSLAGKPRSQSNH